MKKIFFLAVVVCVSAVVGFSQAKPTDFSGTWILDTAKSKLDDRMRVEAMTLTVSQTDKELKVATETKRMPPPTDAPAGGPGGQGGGRGMGRGFGGSEGTVAYSLDGKETVVEIDGPNGKMPVKYKALLETGKATLMSTRTFSGPMGEITMTGKDSWSLSADGKTLTVVREQSTPRGTNSSTMVFTKN